MRGKWLFTAAWLLACPWSFLDGQPLSGPVALSKYPVAQQRLLAVSTDRFIDVTTAFNRLNVFPIESPPLRERLEDIPALARHFIGIYNRKAGKKISGYSDKAEKSMMTYHWPGNIRELENVIERSVLLAKGATLDDVILPASHQSGVASRPGADHVKSIDENERDYILSILKICKDKIWGSGGAAEILNLPATTLRSKMKRLGIEKKYGGG